MKRLICYGLLFCSATAFASDITATKGYGQFLVDEGDGTYSFITSSETDNADDLEPPFFTGDTSGYVTFDDLVWALEKAKDKIMSKECKEQEKDLARFNEILDEIRAINWSK